jgi:Concanavalin A-like lectin/glucanases superfamily
MARAFTKNLSNYMVIGQGSYVGVMAGASQTTAHVWGYANSLDSGVANDLLGFEHEFGFTGLSIGMDTSKIRGFARTSSLDSPTPLLGATTITTGVWIGYGFTADYTAKTMEVFFNGVSDGSASSVAFTDNTIQTTDGLSRNDGIGQAEPADSAGIPAGATRQFDGSIAELGVWNAALTAAELAALGKGYSPRLIRPQSLKFYWPLIGRASPETELINGKVGTITGTIDAAPHARVFYPKRKLA